MASTDVGVSTCSDGSSTGCIGPSTATDVSASLLLRQVVIVLRQAVGPMTLFVSCLFLVVMTQLRQWSLLLSVSSASTVVTSLIATEVTMMSF